MTQKRLLDPAFTLSLVFGTLLLMLAVDLLTHDSVRLIFKENHAIELGAAICFLFAAGLLVALRDTPEMRGQWHLPVILVLMVLRELDMDKRLTSEGVLQLRLYSGPAPLLEKLAGLAVVVLILICAWRLLRITFPVWWRCIRQNAPSAWLAGGAALVIVIAKSLDGLDRKLAPLGITLDPGFSTVAGRIEEILELVAAIMLVQAVAYFGYLRTRS